MSQPRFGSVLTLVRLLAGAAPSMPESPSLSAALLRLQTASDGGEIERLDRMIWRLWSGSGNRPAVRAMTRGLEAMASGNFPAALDHLGEAIAADPTFAEAWNRRATIYFLMGETMRSIEEIEHVLVLEPRHYGALAGLGQVLLQEGEHEGALLAFESALAINPHMPRIRAVVERLRLSWPNPKSQRPMLH